MQGGLAVGNSRLNRVSELLKKEISHIIRDEMKDPRISSMVTSITEVKVSGDLSHAWIYVSIFKESSEEKDGVLEALEKAAGFIRKEVGKRVRLRHIPQLHFVADESIEYGAHINQVLKELIPENEDDNHND